MATETQQPGPVKLWTLEEVVRACNSHYELLAACQAILQAEHTWTIGDEGEPKNDSYDAALRLAKTAVAAVKGECA